MTSITIPARIVVYAREVLHHELGIAAEAIARVSLEGGCAHSERYREPIERFDGIRALLDAIGWREAAEQAPVTVESARDRDLIVAALEGQLKVERDMSDVDTKLKGAPAQAKVAARRVHEIEGFLFTTAAEVAGGGGAR